MVSDAHQRLRAATREAHERLEARADILRRVGATEGRRALVGRFWRLHADVEAAVAPWVEDLEGLEFDTRRRTRHLAEDLATLGLAPAAEPVEPPVVRSVGEALGFCYVLEGSSLGGRVIRRALAAQGSDMVGLSFLDPYGERTGEQWRSFLAVLDRAMKTPEAAGAAIRGAQGGFSHAERRICEGQPA